MKSTDEGAFAAIMAKTWRVYGKSPEGEDVALWFELLEDSPLEAIATAFNRHLKDPDAGRFPPKPADIIRQLQTLQPADGDSGHPGAEEAWGMLLRFVNDERETGLYTEPMRHAWEACDSILKLGDEIGARMCFLETYRKALKQAKEARNPPKWSLTMGSDIERRKMALQRSIEQGRISADYARSLLPAPVASLEHLAGLLEHDGPKPEPGQPSFRERLRDLVAQFKADPPDDAQTPAMQAERERHQSVDDRKPGLPDEVCGVRHDR